MTGIYQRQSSSNVQAQLYRPLARPLPVIASESPKGNAHFEYDINCAVLQLRAIGHDFLAEIASRRILNRRCHAIERIRREYVPGRSCAHKDSYWRFRNQIAHHVVVVALNENVRVSTVEHAILLNAIAIPQNSNILEDARRKRGVAVHVVSISVDENTYLIDSNGVLSNVYVVRLGHQNGGCNICACGGVVAR